MNSRQRADGLPQYSDVFQSPRSSPKHASHQVNGETQMRQHDIITLVNKRKNGRW
ncbi:YpzG family protein [Pullulanibacillus sp. KACC 23026]|uniref:YpzG family protein n=1 Tax=Pullulanibacillus sp. KACC 23026 TaxID=3028315 RepID=UPI0023B15426|nr:YpzG family protein [Pullulanibacillus sp. KACC 23026]WEG12764.1 YpzG family protein [Pullulanibacillus sp. KACC 23026]